MRVNHKRVHRVAVAWNLERSQMNDTIGLPDKFIHDLRVAHIILVERESRMILEFCDVAQESLRQVIQTDDSIAAL